MDLPMGPSLAHSSSVNRLGVTALGQYRWNGGAASEAELVATLDAVARDPLQPELQLIPESAAPYGRVDRVMAMIKRAGVTRVGFVGNEAYRDF